MLLPRMRLPVEVLVLTMTPSPPLPEMTLPSPAPVPPTQLLMAPLKMATPWLVLPRSTVPVTSRPMMLPRITFPLVPAPKICTPSTVLAEMTLRSAAVAPPMTLLVDEPVMYTPTWLPSAAVPAVLVPRKLPATVLFEEARMRIPLKPNRLIARPRIVLPELPASRTSPLEAPAPLPFSSITGVLVKLGSLVPSMTRAPVMVGRPPAPTLMVCGPAPAMLKKMRSAPPTLAVLFAARMARAARCARRRRDSPAARRSRWWCRRRCRSWYPPRARSNSAARTRRFRLRCRCRSRRRRTGRASSSPPRHCPDCLPWWC